MWNAPSNRWFAPALITAAALTALGAGMLKAELAEPYRADLTTLHVRASTTAMTGGFEIVIDGDGEVRYSTRSSGAPDLTADREELEQVVQAFRDVRFFRTNSEFPQRFSKGRRATCQPSSSITLKLGGREHTVSFYHGNPGLPDGLRELPRKLVRIVRDEQG